MNTITSVCFTGHRALPSKKKERDDLCAATAAAIQTAVDRGARRFYTGGAEGYDLLCGELVLELKQTRPELELYLILPYTGFGSNFSVLDQERLKNQIDQAAEVLYMGTHYFPGCMAIRNRQLVEAAELCVAYVRRSPSGTAQTIGFARQKGIEVVYV